MAKGDAPITFPPANLFIRQPTPPPPPKAPNFSPGLFLHSNGENNVLLSQWMAASRTQNRGVVPAPNTEKSFQSPRNHSWHRGVTLATGRVLTHRLTFCHSTEDGVLYGNDFIPGNSVSFRRNYTFFPKSINKEIDEKGHGYEVLKDKEPNDKHKDPNKVPNNQKYI